jgi:hypothetical protein
LRKKLLVLAGIIILIILFIGGKKYMDSKKLNEEMTSVVYSDEAKKIFEDGLKNLDSKALTNDGIIKTYEIDKESVKHNPMGGINVTLFINGNSKLYVFFVLNSTDDNKLIDDGGGNSSELEKLLEGNGNAD